MKLKRFDIKVTASVSRQSWQRTKSKRVRLFRGSNFLRHFLRDMMSKGVLPSSLTQRLPSLWATYWIQSVGVGPELIRLRTPRIPHRAWKNPPDTPAVILLFTSVTIPPPAVSFPSLSISKSDSGIYLQHV